MLKTNCLINEVCLSHGKCGASCLRTLLLSCCN